MDNYPTSANSQGRKVLVLVVDDEEMMRRMALMALTAVGFEVVLAEDGIDALEAFSARHADIAVVLMDVTMPRLGGIEAAEKMREVDPSVKIILSSGYTDKCPEAAKPNAFLPKPYTVDSLFETIRNVIGSGSEMVTP
ncbi:response regulator [Geothrix sp. 21YS21S-2]|uniref:response regulator n=1 Tax=Geothrix sp. 21YS21S-2 TaxID=3068893 RepID=UPI0027BA20B7|nr:response regulator [Geothrix sp. 21YS21S-2]